jgi:hypothetical protein
MFHIRLFKAGHVARVMDINLHPFQFKYLTHLITLTLNNKNKITFYLHTKHYYRPVTTFYLISSYHFFAKDTLETVREKINTDFYNTFY